MYTNIELLNRLSIHGKIIAKKQNIKEVNAKQLTYLLLQWLKSLWKLLMEKQATMA